MRSMYVFVAVCSLTVMFSGAAVDAGTTGTLSVRVVDLHVVPVAGAKVSVSSPSQTATGVTDARGFFGFVNLSPDTYTGCRVERRL